MNLLPLQPDHLVKAKHKRLESRLNSARESRIARESRFNNTRRFDPSFRSVCAGSFRTLRIRIILRQPTHVQKVYAFTTTRHCIKISDLNLLLQLNYIPKTQTIQCLYTCSYAVYLRVDKLKLLNIYIGVYRYIYADKT